MTQVVLRNMTSTCHSILTGLILSTPLATPGWFSLQTTTCLALLSILHTVQFMFLQMWRIVTLQSSMLLTGVERLTTLSLIITLEMLAYPGNTLPPAQGSCGSIPQS